MKFHHPRHTNFPLTLILAVLGVAAFSVALESYVSQASVTLNGTGVSASASSGNFLDLTSNSSTLFAVDGSGNVGANEFYGSTASATPYPNLSFTDTGGLDLNAGGTDQNIMLSPSGAGATVANNLEDKGGQVFNVKAYGATGDGQIRFDGAMTAGSDTLTSASANFSLSDVGKFIYVYGAGSSAKKSQRFHPSVRGACDLKPVKRLAQEECTKAC